MSSAILSAASSSKPWVQQAIEKVAAASQANRSQRIHRFRRKSNSSKRPVELYQRSKYGGSSRLRRSLDRIGATADDVFLTRIPFTAGKGEVPTLKHGLSSILSSPNQVHHLVDPETGEHRYGKDIQFMPPVSEINMPLVSAFTPPSLDQRLVCSCLWICIISR